MGIFARRFRFCIAAMAFFMLGAPGLRSAYAQKYWVTYEISSSANGTTSTFQPNIDFTRNFGSVVSPVIGEYGSNTLPQYFSATAYQSTSDGGNWDVGTYPLSFCVNTGSDVIWGVSFSWTIIAAPNITTTGTAVNQNRVYCPGEVIDLSVTSGFSSYTWQYAVSSNGPWTSIRTTSGNSTQVSGYDIGGKYLQNVYFRAIADNCMESRTTPVGPYKFSPGATVVSTFSLTSPLCKGGNDGKITVGSFGRALLPREIFRITLKNSQGPIGYTPKVGTLPVTLDPSYFAGGIPAGIYTMYVESWVDDVVSTCGSDPQETRVEITDPPAVVASGAVSSNYNGSMIRCVGSTDGAITVSGSGGTGGFQYSSDGGNSYQASPTFSGLGVGNYTFRVKDSKGCLGTSAAVSITAPAPVGVGDAYAISDNGNGGHTSCNLNDTGGTKNDGVLRVEASGGSGAFQYSVAGGTYSVAYQGNADVSSLYPDIYTVTVRDANGCVSADHPIVEIIQPSEITYTGVTHEDLECNGISTGTVELQGASGGIGVFRYSINGSTFQNSNLFETLPAGTVTVTIKDSKGCTKVTAPVVIDQPAPFVFPTVNTSLQSCTEIVDGAISLAPATGGTGALQYSIDDQAYFNESSPVLFSGLVSGTYKVHVMDSRGCKGYVDKFVGIRPVITGGISVSQPISCNGRQDGALNLTPGGGTAPYAFAWSTQVNTEDISGLGDGLYTVTITDSKGCVKEFPYDLQEPGVLSLHPVVSDYHSFGVSCAGSTDGSITLTPQGGTTPYVYSWSTGSAQNEITALAPGSYDVYVTDAHNCEASAIAILVTEPLAVALSLDDFKDVSCFGGSDGQLQALAAGGSGLYEYSLDGSLWQSDALFQGLIARAYTLHMRDANACVATPVSYTLKEPTKLTVSQTKLVDTSCGEANGSAEIKGDGGAGSYVYTWYNADDATVSNSADATALASGDYQAVVTDGNDCKAEMQIIINNSNGPKITQLSLQGLTCHDSNDGAISVSVNGGLAPYTMNWDTEETGLAVANVTGGQHWMEVYDASGCRGKTVFDVPYPPALAIGYTAANPLCTGNADGSLAVDVSGGNPGAYAITWSTGDTGVTIGNLKAGTYGVTVKDVKNCILREDVTLTDPPVFTVDAGGDRTICVGQKLTVRAEEDNATYQWTSDAGYNSGQREVVLTAPAHYTLRVISKNGCVAEDRFTLATSTDLLTTDFLMITEAHAGDTVVMIDVSWPAPERIDWTFPQSTSVLSEEDMYADVVFKSPGQYEVLLTTHLGECVSTYTKTITILDERAPQNGRAATDLVTVFEVFPNPNDGEFTVNIEFSEEAKGRLRMLSLSGNVTLFEEPLKGGTAYAYEAALQSAPSGVYFLILEANGKQYTKRVIIK